MRPVGWLVVARRRWRGVACALPLALSALLTPGELVAQGWQGTGRVSGIVRGADGQPLAGATVVLRWARDPEQGPPPTVTDGKGRWAYLGLAPGRFLLTVRADGHRESHGTVEVRDGPAPRVEVTLESLAVETPRFSERRREDLLAWIEAGNSLLAAGEWAAARAEYEKALGELEGESRAEVLRAVARTHYMEGDLERSLERLEEAIVLAPEEASGRAIYRSIMQAEGRSDEAERFLARVDAGELAPAASGGPAAAESEAAGEEPRTPVPVEVEPDRTGRFRTGFRQRHPDSTLEVLAERFGRPIVELARAEAAGERYDVAGERFAVFVPQRYEPRSASSEEGWGLVVWVSPTDEGEVPAGATEAVLADRRLLWVGADGSGNQRLTWQRIALALDAAHNMSRYYDLDPQRIYVAGYSGGGRVASALALLFPETFRGGLFLYGVDFYRRVPIPDRPGSDWLPWFPAPSRAALERLRETTRLVLVTGERDFNRMQVRTFAEEYREEGFEHLTYIEIPGASHYDWPSRRWLEEAFAALDGAD